MGKRTEVVVNGKKFKSTLAACRFVGINCSTVYTKAKTIGCSINTAIEMTILAKIKINVNVMGEKFESALAACRHFDLSRSTVREKAAKEKCTNSEAIERLILKREEYIKPELYIASISSKHIDDFNYTNKYIKALI